MSNSLYVAWRGGEDTGGRWGPVGRLDRENAGYRFVYTRGARSLEGFRPFPDMPDLEEVYESEELFPIFANRLLCRSRSEYKAFLEWGGFDPKSPPDLIAVLGITEGRRATDSLEVFPCPVPDADGRFVSKFFLHGVRWMPTAVVERIGGMKSGAPLGLMLDVSNEHDPYAVAVRTCESRDRLMIGYVPRYLARDLHQLCEESDGDHIKVTVQRVNRDAPLQQRLLCRMEARWPEGFRPCLGEEYEPIVRAVPAMS